MNMHRLDELRPAGPLAGRIVRIEPIEERHREGLREAAERDPQIHRYTNMYSLGFDRWFDLALESTSEVPFVVCLDGRPVGSSRYLNVEPFHKRLEIGWTWLERAQWGTGANIETKYLLMRNAFDGWGAMRVEFKTDARNLRVRGALLGVGASFDGIFRKHMILPDSIRDSAWYSVLDDDWPRVKRGFAVLDRRYGMDLWTLNMHCNLLAVSNDRAAALPILERIGERSELEVWGSHETYLKFRDWARRQGQCQN